MPSVVVLPVPAPASTTKLSPVANASMIVCCSGVGSGGGGGACRARSSSTVLMSWLRPHEDHLVIGDLRRDVDSQVAPRLRGQPRSPALSDGGGGFGAAG